ncbi:MAG: elongation factor [Ignavibacteria bacterium]|nr:elongation factor [Ignavibacteria bacterium]
MKSYEPKNIRNIAFLGHSGSGKTTISESILFQTGAINRRGTVDDRNTVSDYNDIEHEKGCSILCTPLYAEYNDVKINMVDTPGYDDYIGEIIAALKVCETGMMVINSQNGVEVATNIIWEVASQSSKSMMFAINKLDVEQAHFDKNVTDIQESFGRSATIFQYPLQTGANFNTLIDVLTMSAYKFSGDTGFDKIEIPASETAKAEKLHNELIESIAEVDEELMNKYLEEGLLTEEEIWKGLKVAVATCQIFPIICLSGKNNIGTELFLQYAEKFLPSPLDAFPVVSVEGDKIEVNPHAPVSLFVFKLTSEAHLGDMTFFKVYSGTMKSGLDLYNEHRSSTERFGQIFVINGKKRAEAPALCAGDIGATVKLKNTGINDTLHEKGKQITIPKMVYPITKVRTAVVPRTKGEEDKVGIGLNNLSQEDPSLRVEHSQELRQIILHAQGELHLGIAKWRLEHRYRVEAEFIEPRVPYRETIQKQVKGSYRHKKQSGGAGQFAEVHMMIDPWHENMPKPEDMSVRGKDLIELDWGGKLEFVNCIVGGVIDQRFLPAILKGVMDKMTIGPLTGSYVRDIRVCIYDGKMHPVDSNEAAFKTAGMMVFKDNFIQASPKILEPIYNVEIRVPEDSVGDVMSDLPTRRGLILGIDSEGRYQKIKARMPLAELDKYSTALRSMTAGRATYTQEFAEYQSVPPSVQQQLMDDYKKRHDEE